jgi:hypothetical protein
MKPFPPIQMDASPFLERFTLSSMKMKPFPPIQMMHPFVWGEKASFSCWREIAGKPPQKWRCMHLYGRKIDIPELLLHLP